jgi:aryl-alcohol dehydrogenase-like predicted oxidoreductase
MNSRHGGTYSRRDFLRQTSLIAAGPALSGLAPSAHAAAMDGPQTAAGSDTAGILNYSSEMKYRRLGKTGLMVSEVSLGGHWSNRDGGRFWVQFANDKVPDDVLRNRSAVLSRCIERGINYVDPVTSAELLSYGKALKGRRDRFYVGASSHLFNPWRKENCTVEKQLANIDDALRLLDTDYLDIWRPMFRQDGKHQDSDIEACIEAFEKAKTQGKTRFLGLSSHKRSFLLQVIEKYPQFSMVIFPYTAISKVKPANLQSIDPGQIQEIGTGDSAFSGDVSGSIFDSARKNDVGIITIKPFGGGSLFRTKLTFEKTQTTRDDDERARLTLAYILHNQDISATIPGMTTLDQIDNNVSTSRERLALLDESGVRKLRLAAHEMRTRIPEEYRWLHQWEWV